MGVPSHDSASNWRRRPPTTGPGAGGTEAGSIGNRIENFTDCVRDGNTFTMTRPSPDWNVISWPGVLQAATGAGAGALGGGATKTSLSLSLSSLSSLSPLSLPLLLLALLLLLLVFSLLSFAFLLAFSLLLFALLLLLLFE